MKKRFAVLFCGVFLLFAVPVGVLANSGPAHWENSPSFSITPLENCPVSVSREDLSFDFSAEERGDYSPQARVSAAYQMKNPTAKPVKVQMAFPLISSLDDFQKNGTRITAGGKDIPFDIYLGETKPKSGTDTNYYSEDGKLIQTSLPSFSQILSSVSTKTNTQKAIGGTGKQYVLTADKDCGVKVSTTDGKTCIFSTGFNDYSSNGTTMSLACQMQKGSVLTFLALGGQNPVVETFESDGLSKKTDQVKIHITDVSPEDYLKNIVMQSRMYKAYPSEKLLTRMTSALESYVQNQIKSGSRSISAESFSNFFSQPRMIVLCFETQFPAKGTQNVTVQYPMSGAMNAAQTQAPIYSYGYLLNPAKGWAGFQNLNIKVIPPKSNPYVVQSSLSLNRAKDGAYTASLPSLPQNDLVFSIYPKAKTEPKSVSSIEQIGGISTVAIIVFLAVLIGVLAVAAHLKVKQ